MKKLLITGALLATACSLSVLAREGANVKANSTALTTLQAYERIQAIKPAAYDAIERITDEGSAVVYIATSHTDPSLMTVIDGSSGADLSARYTSSKYQMDDVLRFVQTSFDGQIIQAIQEMDIEHGLVYLVTVESQWQQHQVLVISASTLKVLETGTPDEYQTGLFTMASDELPDDYLPDAARELHN